MLNTKNILGVTAAIVMCASIAIVVNPRAEKDLSGTVVNCANGSAIAGATITARQRGWGISNGGLVWDKEEISTSTTNVEGKFTIAWNTGKAAQLAITKEAFFETLAYGTNREQLRIRMLEIPTGYNDYLTTTFEECVLPY